MRPTTAIGPLPLLAMTRRCFLLLSVMSFSTLVFSGRAAPSKTAASAAVGLRQPSTPLVANHDQVSSDSFLSPSSFVGSADHGLEEDPSFLPHLSLAERNLFDRTLAGATSYFEFGSGGSTIWALSHHPNLKHVHAVESDAKWISRLKQDRVISTAIGQGRLRLQHAYIGETKEWGKPINRDLQAIWPVYCDEIRKAKEVQRWDVVLVDGRFRVACFLKAIDAVKDEPGAEKVRLLVHDYRNRPEYHVVERFAERVETVETMVAFRLRPKISRQELRRVIQKYARNPAAGASSALLF